MMNDIITRSRRHCGQQTDRVVACYTWGSVARNWPATLRSINTGIKTTTSAKHHADLTEDMTGVKPNAGRCRRPAGQRDVCSRMIVRPALPLPVSSRVADSTSSCNVLPFVVGSCRDNRPHFDVPAHHCHQQNCTS